MRRYLFVIVLVYLMLAGLAGRAQYGLYHLEQNPPADPYDELTFYSVGANILTNNAYMGRQDSAALPYLTTYLGYQFYFGLYANLNASYAPLYKYGQFDLISLNIGYDHIFWKHLLTGINVEKNFFHAHSPSIRSGIEQAIDIYAKRNDGLLEPQIGYTAITGAAFSDVVMSFSVDHRFRFRENTINILPMFTFNFGSTNFYNDYFIRRLKKYDPDANYSAIVTNAGNTKPLDIEFSAQTIYMKGEWLLKLTPTLMIPLNTEDIYLPKGKTREILSSVFLLELDVCYRHERK